MPDPRLLNVPVVCAVPPFKLYDKGGVPPVAEIFILPLPLPKHVTLLAMALLMMGAAALLISAVPAWLHPLASVTTILYVPAGNDWKLAVGWKVVPLLTLYWYGAVPPLTVRLIAPSELPQVELVALEERLIIPGWEIVEVDVAVHPLASDIIRL